MVAWGHKGCLTKMPNEVADPTPEWRLGIENRRIVDDLLSGTAVMRKANTRYLPQEAKEDNDEYENRISRTTLFNAFKRTVGSLTGKPFSREIRTRNMPEDVEEWMKNIDLQGNSFDVFCKDNFKNALADGVRFILIDFPVSMDIEGVTPNLSAEREQKLRPYFVDVDPRNLIGWQTVTVDGVEMLVQARIREIIRRPDPSNRFEGILVERIRVFERGSFEVWERTISTPERTNISATVTPNRGDFQIVSSGTMSIPVIPIIAVYTNQTDFFLAEPPMIDLMYMNIEHWQSKSDQNNILHVARVPILYGAGFADDEMSLIQVGGKRSINNSNSDATLSFTELEGKSIEAGEKSLENLENRMRIEGLELLVKKQQVTATERALDARDLDSELASDVRDAEDSYLSALKIMLQWVNQDPESIGEIDIHKDFGIAFRDSTELSELFKARQAGDITQETYLNELQRRGVLSTSVDLEEEVLKTEADQPDPFPAVQPFGSTSAG